MPKLCPKVILEGTRLTGKTDLAFALSEHPRVTGPRKYRYHHPLISGEWCGFTNTPWGRGLINFEPGEQGRALETYDAWLRASELLPYYPWIIDRFHLSTLMWQREQHGAGEPARLAALEAGLRSIDDRLMRLGFRLILCVRREDSFEAARRERLRVSGNPSQYDDLTVFAREQRRLLELARWSRLPRLLLDVTDLTPEQRAERAADWLSRTGGLYACGVLR
ncbi:MAG: hypothetical protein AAF356_00035 [Planctomycetota bacterium]